MMVNTEIDKKLKFLLDGLNPYGRVIESIFEDCETQEERQLVIDFIEQKKPKLGKVLEFVAVIAIEAGRAEGELEDCDDDYWDNED